ncbi:MAG: TetR/AcrR family transcriptional regulator [Alcaligenaceae bacterium]|nr:MAG: TetR/AcrR family transcriptional regulator [Alcaligenaceae bacterium]
MTPAPKKLSFKQQQLLLREDAILDAVNRLLASKGFDLMTMDEVAAEVGIAKASLYKHFQSKDELAASSMTRLLENALAFAAELDPGMRSLERLKALARWSIRKHMRREMPLLPSTRSTIQHVLINHAPYAQRLSELTEIMGEWIMDAQARQELSSALPAEVILYTIYARSCDPVVDFLKMGGAFSDEEIVEHLITVSFDGMCQRSH